MASQVQAMDPVAGNKTWEFCHSNMEPVDSVGIWRAATEGRKLSSFSLVNLEVQIAFIIGSQKALSYLFGWLGIPSVVAQILVGIGFGKLFNWVDMSDDGQLDLGDGGTGVFSVHSQMVLSTLSTFGFILYLFLSGVKMEPRTVIRRSGRKAILIGFVTMAVPILAAVTTTSYLNTTLIPPSRPFLGNTTIQLSVLHAMTTFPVISALLGELEILTSELGRLAISSSVAADAMHVLLFLFVAIIRNMKLYHPGDHWLRLLFLITVLCFVRPVFAWIVKRTPEGRQVKDVYVVCIIVGVMALTRYVVDFGTLALIVPFLIGVMVPDGPPLGLSLTQKLEPLVSGILMPLFVTTCAMRTNIDANLLTDPVVMVTMTTAAVVTLLKCITCAAAAVSLRIPMRDSVSLGLILSSKGAIDVAAYMFLKDEMFITEGGFTAMVFATLLVAILVPLLVRLLFDSSRQYAAYVKRNVEMLSHQDELRVIMCIHKSENTPSFLNLLGAGAPSLETPMFLSVVHLIELVGRTTPLFISHSRTVQRKQTDNSDKIVASSRHIIDAFEAYIQKLPASDAISLEMYTSVTTTKLMQGDIFNLALDKVASIIFVPFHVKWAEDGSPDVEDFKMRSLNKVVIEQAPCSVGILLDRGNLSSTASLASSFSVSYFNIAVLFFGGKDDREASCYALRMMYGSPNTTLTVIHFTHDEEDYDEDDMEVLKTIQDEEKENRRLKYMEEVVKDGPQTALIVRSIVNEYDLMVVGRREGLESAQTSGLLEWIEFPELGVIGDLLAVADLETRTSVLVVQQQKLANYGL